MPLRPGFVYLAKGGYHLLIDGSGENPKLLLTETELEHGCRPAIDVTLRSVHQFYGGRVLVVILTGMGRDGAEGAALIRHSGGLVFVQNPDSSTVSSMPRQAIETAGADRIGELEELGQWINQTVSRNARVR
jgi:two-component system chemotaxis response regulator CheB